MSLCPLWFYEFVRIQRGWESKWEEEWKCVRACVCVLSQLKLVGSIGQRFRFVDREDVVEDIHDRSKLLGTIEVL